MVNNIMDIFAECKLPMTTAVYNWIKSRKNPFLAYRSYNDMKSSIYSPTEIEN